MTSAGTVGNSAVRRIVRVVGTGDSQGLRFTVLDAADDALDHACVEADGCFVVHDAAADARFAGIYARVSSFESWINCLAVISRLALKVLRVK